MATRMKNPPHIGGFIKTEVIEAAGSTITAAANKLGVSRQALNNLVNEKNGLTCAMALKIEATFGPKADHLMMMQLDYDMAKALAART